MNDPSDRFGYWPSRIASGGEVLAPGRPERQVQFIDVIDLASWTLHAVESGLTGEYNLRGPEPRSSMARLLATCAEVTSGEPRLTWVDDAFLVASGLTPYVDLPLWIPEDPETVGFTQVSAAKAIAARLRCRPIEDTVRDALAWELLQPTDRERKAGLTRQREATLLAAWHSR